MTEKLCVKCKTVKALEHFALNRTRKDGHQTTCRECFSTIYQKARTADPVDRGRRRQRDRDRYEGRLAWTREWRQRNAEHMRAYNRAYRLQANFGLTLEQWDEMYERQNGQCAICLFDIAHHADEDSKNTHVDHDHFNGQVRGLLCSPCNKALGFLQDNAGIMRRAADYVDFWAIAHQEESCRTP